MCDSIYFGDRGSWKCRLEEGHKGHHRADKYSLMDGREIFMERDYCSWSDDDVMYSLLHYISRGGNK